MAVEFRFDPEEPVTLGGVGTLTLRIHIQHFKEHRRKHPNRPDPRTWFRELDRQPSFFDAHDMADLADEPEFYE